MCVQIGIAGVGNDIGLLRRGGVVGQIQVELRHAARRLDGEAALGGGGVHGDADLERAVILAAVGVEGGGAVLAGVHLVAGGPILLHCFQGRIVLRHKDGALGGVGGVHLGFIVVDPGGGGGGHIHHAGVILPAVDALQLDAVGAVLCGPFQAELVHHFHAAHVPVFLGPEGQAGVEVLRPAVGKAQDGLDAVKNADFLSVRGGFRQNIPASGKGGAGDGELAAGGPNRHLGGVFVLVLRQTGDAPHIIGVKLLELLQGAVRIAIRKGSHRLRFPVVLLHRQGLRGGYPFQPVVDAVGGAGQTVIAGVLPVAAADGAALGGAQVLAIPGLLDRYGAAAFQRCGAGGDGQQAEQRSHHQQHGQQAVEMLVFHRFSFHSGHKKRQAVFTVCLSDALIRLSYFVLPGTNSSFRKAVCSGARSGWLG